MTLVKNLNLGKFKPPVILFVLLSGGLLLHFGKPPEGRPHNNFEMVIMGVGASIILIGVVTLIVLWLRGTASNARERAIVSSLRQIIAEDHKQRGTDDRSQG